MNSEQASRGRKVEQLGGENTESDEPEAESEETKIVVEQEIRYRTWASEQLLKLVDQEEERRKGLENKAMVWTSVLAVVVGIIARSLLGSDDFSMASWSVSWFLVLLGFLLTLLTFIASGMSIFVRDYSAVDPEQFADLEELEQYSVPERLDAILEHLKEVVESTANEVDKTAVWVLRTQKLALLSLCFFLAALAWAALANDSGNG